MEVRQDRSVRLNWITINVPTIISIVTAIMIGTWGWANTNNRISSVEKARDTRTIQTERRFDEINNSIAGLRESVTPLDNITYRVGVLEGSLSETNDRIDRLSEAILSSLDLIRRDVNGLSTRVEVLSQKIDNISEETRSRDRADLAPQSRTR